MRTSRQSETLGFLFVVCGLFLLANGVAALQQDAAAAKRYAEIAGDYEFVMGMDVMTVRFFVEDGKLMGSPPGETPEEIVPVEGEELAFTVTIAGGEEYDLTFIRDENGNLTQCLMESPMGEIMGDKIGG